PDDRAAERLDNVIGNEVAPRAPQSHAVPWGRPVEEAGGRIEVHAPERDGVRPRPGEGVPDRVVGVQKAVLAAERDAGGKASPEEVRHEAVVAAVRRRGPGGRAVGRAPRPRLVVGGRAAGGAAGGRRPAERYGVEDPPAVLEPAHGGGRPARALLSSAVRIPAAAVFPGRPPDPTGRIGGGAEVERRQQSERTRPLHECAKREAREASPPLPPSSCLVRWPAAQGSRSRRAQFLQALRLRFRAQAPAGAAGLQLPVLLCATCGQISGRESAPTRNRHRPHRPDTSASGRQAGSTGIRRLRLRALVEEQRRIVLAHQPQRCRAGGESDTSANPPDKPFSVSAAGEERPLLVVPVAAPVPDEDGRDPGWKSKYTFMVVEQRSNEVDVAPLPGNHTSVARTNIVN
ncbi:hypothetical protein THAOC_37339, partial [Thalassiosira oceanica]